MLTLPFFICKSLASHTNSFNLIRKRNIFKTNFLRCNSKISASKVKPKKNLIKFFDGSNETINNHGKLAAKLINEYSESESIRWDELINKLKDSQVTNVRSAILRGCLNLVNAKAGLSFYNYLMEKEEKLTLVDCVIFSKLFISQKCILENETLVKNLYNNVKNHMMESPMIQELALNLVAKTPSCFFDFVERSQGNVNKPGKELILIKALDYDCFDLMLQILKNVEPSFNEVFITAYLNYLTRMSTNRKFLPDLVTTLTVICEKKASTLVCTNLLLILRAFVETVNQHQNDYLWSANACQISNENVCSNCGFQLLGKPISDAEFKMLKENCFLKIGLLNKNVFLSSSEKEFQNFLLFLDKCQPYDVVVDFLNVFHQVRQFKVERLILILRELIDRGHKVLIISRRHMKNKILNNNFLKRNINGKIQVFFTDDMSDDDVFVLYSAMHNGPGKYIVSRDYFAHYVPHLDENCKDIFLRWKMYHQYMIKNRDIVPPTPHLGVPQLTSTPDKNKQKFVWHLSYKSDNSSPKINYNVDLKWICLEAVKNQ